MSEEQTTDELGEIFLEILREINKPSIPEDTTGIVVCSCGCGAWKQDDGRIT